ncbi:outer membrane protein assembly factor BamB family protein [Sulfidibacter corallicola]|uniref:PQQ-binding-like beta-propeller repeat protein n=1 Tax=Sulfidibacter corallicola TaxID=2818388 RepID=A0A8A4TKL0_SULCO|nr:PQQ-binding-like beta-propeller repeat protein [Sulfidibacter corallicola]QTD50080.1 PQQ-binding-like beta-propeller repeat protein [Sulfidibacter corallicola]
MGSGYSSVSIGSGIAVTLYGGETRDYAVAFDALSGDKRWSYDIGEAYKGVGGSYDGPLATPLIDGDRVYALGPRGDLFALNAQSGKEIFRLNIKDLGANEPRFGFTSSPLVVGEVLIVHVGGPEAKAGLIGLDKRTGKQLWAGPAFYTTYDTGSMVRLLGKDQFAVCADKKMVGVDPQNGQQLWEFETDLNYGGHITQVSDDKLYIHPSDYQAEGMLLEVSRENDTYGFEILWRTRELGKGFGMVLHHKGYLYGYSGRFMTCIDVATGSRQWKSRPPGPGFLILLDDHLVAVTRKGSVHLIEATHEAYREKASLEVFDEVAYNPAAFAHGKLYVRSMKSIAALNVGNRKESVIADKGEGTLPNSRFAATVKKLEKATDQKAAIDKFMAKQKRFPIIEGDDTAHVIYRGPAEDAALRAQSLGHGREIPMRRVGDSDLFYYSFELDPAAHITYSISTNFGEATVDALNPHSAKLMWDDESLSILAMPRFSDSNHLAETSLADPAAKGRIEEFELESEHTGHKRKYKVYLPAGYDTSETRYPVVYVDYGFSALDKGLMARTLDRTIGKRIQPLIAVFVPPQPNLYAERDLESGKKFAAMLAEELVPHVDKTYRTRAEKSGRGLIGHYGLAPATLYAALEYPDRFGKVATQSGLFEQEFQDIVLTAAAKIGGDKPDILLEWGSYDHLNDSRRDVSGWHGKLAKSLKEKGLTVQSVETPMGVGWGNWRTRQDDLLKWLFPIEQN